jgi:hypothetical protein
MATQMASKGACGFSSFAEKFSQPLRTSGKHSMTIPNKKFIEIEKRRGCTNEFK